MCYGRNSHLTWQGNPGRRDKRDEANQNSPVFEKNQQGFSFANDVAKPTNPGTGPDPYRQLASTGLHEHQPASYDREGSQKA